MSRVPDDIQEPKKENANEQKVLLIPRAVSKEDMLNQIYDLVFNIDQKLNQLVGGEKKQ